MPGLLDWTGIAKYGIVKARKKFGRLELKTKITRIEWKSSSFSLKFSAIRFVLKWNEGKNKQPSAVTVVGWMEVNSGPWWWEYRLVRRYIEIEIEAKFAKVKALSSHGGLDFGFWKFKSFIFFNFFPYETVLLHKTM